MTRGNQMSVYEVDKVVLIEAANRLARAIKASEKREVSEPLQHKGKTLYHVNRETCKLAKITVNY
jgi:hypothetical protein